VLLSDTFGPSSSAYHWGTPAVADAHHRGKSRGDVAGLESLSGNLSLQLVSNESSAPGPRAAADPAVRSATSPVFHHFTNTNLLMHHAELTSMFLAASKRRISETKSTRLKVLVN
jgi:hypothetical protein